MIRRELRDGPSADDVSRAVEAILRKLRRGEAVSLPGVGRLVPDGKRSVRLERRKKQGGRLGRG